MCTIRTMCTCTKLKRRHIFGTMAAASSKIEVFCIYAYQKPSYATVDVPNERNFRKYCFPDSRTVILCPRKPGRRVRNSRGEDFYKLLTNRDPEVPFAGTIIVASYHYGTSSGYSSVLRRRGLSSLKIDDIQESSSELVNKYMTFFNGCSDWMC